MAPEGLAQKSHPLLASLHDALSDNDETTKIVLMPQFRKRKKTEELKKDEDDGKA